MIIKTVIVEGKLPEFSSGNHHAPSGRTGNYPLATCVLVSVQQASASICKFFTAVSPNPFIVCDNLLRFALNAM